jgi:hypothetical protein
MVELPLTLHQASVLADADGCTNYRTVALGTCQMAVNHKRLWLHSASLIFWHPHLPVWSKNLSKVFSKTY